MELADLPKTATPPKQTKQNRSNKMTTINLAPTRSEHARITAYILASHLKGSPYTFGDYWNYTEAEENALFATWNQLEEIHKVYQQAGMSFYEDCPKGHKAKLIIRLYNQNLAYIAKGTVI